MLTRLPGVRLTVAHFDHGIRTDSLIDRKLVQLTAREYDLPFVYERGRLGPQASEAAARTARYAFLHRVRQASGARAVITAHHQDDALETAVLNLLRGTGRRGLSSLRSTDVVLRPLLHIPKTELLRYAAANGLVWREDSTNGDVRYLRNYIRHRLLPRFTPEGRTAMLQRIADAHTHNAAIEAELTNYLHIQPGPLVLDRQQFILLPHVVARDVLAEWLRLRTGATLSRRMLERLVVAAKTGRAGSKADVDSRHWLEIGRGMLALKLRER